MKISKVYLVNLYDFSINIVINVAVNFAKQTEKGSNDSEFSMQ